MPNVASQISSHNKRVLNKTETNPRLCNCVNRSLCPLDGKCLTRAIIYRGNIRTDDGEHHKYVGLSEPPFKGRSLDHKTSFNDRKYEVKTDMSKKVWELKDKGKVPNVTFSLVRKSSPYQPGSDHCNLCLCEKFHIMKDNDLINKRDELVSKCRHVNKFLLKNFKDKNR